jgi:8-amino-3,8-dideoxy-alpha-D-manno-octulosonate transaminase
VLTDKLAIDGGTPVRRNFPPLGKGIDLVGDEEIDAVTAVLRDRSLFRYHSSRTPGRVAEFESAAGKAFGAGYALATSSGTAALRCALAALGVGCGDEVLVPAFTFIATVGAVVNMGAVPVFVEVDESLTLDVRDVAQKISDRTVAVIPVHLENAPCAMDELMSVAHARGIAVLEDACQAAGVTYHERVVGTIGDLGVLSFQETKNITTGEGGLVLTNDETMYVRAARFQDQGGQFVTQYRGTRGPDLGEPFIGDNVRMTEIAGAIGTVQLARLPALLDAMRANCDRVRAAIGVVEGLMPRATHDAAGAGGSSLTWFAPDAAIARRMIAALRAEGVPAAQMYDAEPVYLNAAVKARRTAADKGGPWNCAEHPSSVRYEPGTCPRTEALVPRSVTVGIGPRFSARDCDDVAAGVRKVAAHLLGKSTPSA